MDAFLIYIIRSPPPSQMPLPPLLKATSYSLFLGFLFLSPLSLSLSLSFFIASLKRNNIIFPSIFHLPTHLFLPSLITVHSISRPCLLSFSFFFSPFFLIIIIIFLIWCPWSRQSLHGWPLYFVINGLCPTCL